MTDTAAPAAPLRRSLYLIVILAGTGIVLGRVLAVDSVDMLNVYSGRLKGFDDEKKKKRESLVAAGSSGEQLEADMRDFEARYRRERIDSLMRPFLSGNDRSRWCTIRALVEPDMWVYEEVQANGEPSQRWVPYAIDKVIQEPGWDTIDMVKHDREGRGGLGANEGHLYSSKPPLLPTVMAGEYWVLFNLFGWELGEHPYLVGRIILVTFNVLPLLVSFVLLAHLAERFGTTDWGRLFVVTAGVFGTLLTTFAVVLNNHLLGAVSAMIALAAAIPICFDGERRWHYFVLAGLFGAFTAANEMPALSFLGLLGLVLLWRAPVRTMLLFTPAALVVAAGFFGSNWIAHGSLVPAYATKNAPPEENWYDYSFTLQRGKKTVVKESYWKDPSPVDRGVDSRPMYVFHALVGHHGVFSLTPIWLLTAAGLGMWLVRPGDVRLRWLAALIAAASLVCFAFYLLVVTEMNYGGQASGFRWMFWFAPLWLVGMLPAADWMARHWWTRGLALALLCMSCLSAAYPTWNPWTQPWVYHALESYGLF